MEVTRDYVLEITAVLPTGQIETFGSKVVKNSSGYGIKDLLIGSEARWPLSFQPF